MTRKGVVESLDPTLERVLGQRLNSRELFETETWKDDPSYAWHQNI